MKTILLKSLTVLTSVVVLSACNNGSKSDSSNITPTVGPQGRVTAFGTNTYCDFSNGQISCTRIDPTTGATCNTVPRTYNNQDINSLCQEVRNIHNESQLAGAACNVSAATSRVLSDFCNGVGGTNPNWPNPNLPPQQPARFLNCNVSMNGSYPTAVSLLAGYGESSFTLFLSETRTKTVWRILNFYYPSSLGSVKLLYKPSAGRIPETLTVVGKIRDRQSGRGEIFVKHSGSAKGRYNVSALVNGNTLDVDCNNTSDSTFPVSESANLVCTGSSHVVGSTKHEDNIQFIRPINSIVSNEDMAVSEALRVSLDKATGMLTTKTMVDAKLGPDMTSTSSIRADTLTEAFEGSNGKANLKCTIR